MTELYHHGIKGQHWGVRRYQNEDGTYTAEGAARRRTGDTISENKNIISKVGRSSKDAPQDLRDKVNKINGGKIGYTRGYNRTRNCSFCAMTYEQVSRGKDVRAKASTLGGYGDWVKNVVTNYKSKDYKTFANDEKSMIKGTSAEDYESLCNDILKDGKNTRGTIQVKWKGNRGGHIFNYETKDGKVYFVDGQVSKVMNKEDAYDTYFKNAYNVRKLRLDNKKLNKKIELFSESSKNELNKSWRKIHKEPKSAAALSTESTAKGIILSTVASTANIIIPGLGYAILFAPELVKGIKEYSENKNAQELIEQQKNLKIDQILQTPPKQEDYNTIDEYTKALKKFKEKNSWAQ